MRNRNNRSDRTEETVKENPAEEEAVSLQASPSVRPDQNQGQEERTFSACILAAGFSSRMGAFKPLLPLGEKTVIERAIAVAKAAGIRHITIVTGHNRASLLPVLQQEQVEEAFNPRFEEGMFTSIQTGIAAQPPQVDGCFIIPVDIPLIDRDVLERLKEGFESDQFAVPCYRGKKGHPLLVPSCFWQEILDYQGNGGLKAVTDRHFDQMKRIPVTLEGVVMDMDTPQAYKEVRDYLAGGCKSESLEHLAEGKRFFFVRHGQIEQHEEKIFLGQTDVPLSLQGRYQAKTAGEILAEMPIHTNRIYSSDLLRASQTAQILKEHMGLQRLMLDKGLREMNLGPWDGKFISEIRAQYPDEYEKRGKDLMAYKMGEGSENFFDLQYRAVKALIRILKKDPFPDLILVTHSGVIRALDNNLQGRDISDEWKPVGNGQVRIVKG